MGDVALTDSQMALLRTAAVEKSFHEVLPAPHHKTTEALVKRGLVSVDRTGKKLKVTAKGRKLLQKQP